MVKRIKIERDILAKKIFEQNLTQDQFAKMIGVCPETVNRWVRGKIQQIDADRLKKVALVLNCSVEDFQKSSDYVANKESLLYLAQGDWLERQISSGNWKLIHSILDLLNMLNLRDLDCRADLKRALTHIFSGHYHLLAGF